MKFSQRIGKSPIAKSLQLDHIDTDLKNGLWSALRIYIFDKLGKINFAGKDSEFDIFCKMLWLQYYKLPIDTIHSSPFTAENYIRERYFASDWFEVYDFIEFVYSLFPHIIHLDIKEFGLLCNNLMEKENSGYRIIENKICPITNSVEINEIESAISNTSLLSSINGANIHLNNSLDKISDKKAPDYRNSIKESISAVECVAKKISENKSDTLGGALDKIKGKAKIHPALEKGFKQIYGYTSDDNGIRHALIGVDNCDFEDAKFMLVSCSAFINYLIVKAEKCGIKLKD